MNTITIELETLTPIWTGDVAQECNAIKPQGIKGSLRWWYEAIVRFLGGWACDPTAGEAKRTPTGAGGKPCNASSKDMASKVLKWAGQHSSDPIAEKIQATSPFLWELDNSGKPVRCVCDACAMFGCTGWASRFNLIVEGGSKACPPGRVRVRKPGQGDRQAQYYYDNLGGIKSPQKVAPGGHILLKFSFPLPVPFPFMTGFKLALCLAILRGNMGAKAQHGMGYVTGDLHAVQAPNKGEIQQLADAMSSPPNPSATNGLPNLGQFFFSEWEVNDRNCLNQQGAFWMCDQVKWPVRQLFRPAAMPGCDKDECERIRHEVCGFVAGPTRVASKVNLSRVFSPGGEDRPRIRVWGWIPSLRSCTEPEHYAVCGSAGAVTPASIIKDYLSGATTSGGRHLSSKTNLLYWFQWPDSRYPGPRDWLIALIT